jgi:glyoxylase-like metal-dependent hydrolase (beta-lactamase superfamily II)
VTILIGTGVFLAIFRRDVGRNVPLLDGSTLTILPGIHLLGDLGPAAAYVVESSDGLILIDTGLDSDARQLKSQMARLGLDWRKSRAILLTHVHGDHCGGAEHLRTATGAKVYAGQADAPFLRAGGPREAVFSTFYMPDHAPHPTTVDVALQGHESMSFGNVRVRVLGAPGHTPGSTCYLVERAGLRLFFAGDVIQRLSPPTLGTYSTYLAPRFRGDARSYLATLNMLYDLPVPDLVLPGHPNSCTLPQSPRLTSQDWTTLLEGGIVEMQRLLQRYESDGENFLDNHPKRLLPELYYLGDFQDVAVYGFFAASKFFVVNAPGGSGLADFLKTRLREFGREPTDPTAILLTACGELETAGLTDLVERSNAQVVASPEGVAGVRQLCPPGTIVVSALDLPQKDWFPVTPISLGGRGVAPVAYLVKWTGKNVLFSGVIPAGIDENPPAELLADLAKSKQNVLAYNVDLERLAELQPDLWLPTVPCNGRNGNLYGREWAEIIEKNRRAASYALQSGQFRRPGGP